LFYQIVPNDKRDFIQDALEEIWSDCGDVVPLAVYTDNPRVDKSAVEAAYASAFPENLDPIDVLLVFVTMFTETKDVFHAKNRIVKELPIQHPDFRPAVSDLSSILKKLELRSYQDVDAFIDAMEQWKVKYSTAAPSALSVKEQIEFLGIVTKIVLIIRICCLW